ncbi:MAG TPA: diguanylate cyclase [Pilimelia sp.]|nr:diguanylate cyclase [Pilimelia sp.]
MTRDIVGGPAVARDAMTGAVDRQELGPALAAALGAASRAGAGCAVMLFDVDHFKRVNDAYGHARGDEVLRAVAERVRAVLRPGSALFRYGGDEFVLVVPHADAEAAEAVAYRVVDAVGDTAFPGDPPLSVTISLGCAVFPADGADPDALLAAADQRNYAAKRAGRARAVVGDAAPGDAAGGEPSRLIERDAGLTTVREFLDSMLRDGSGHLRVTGPRGAGHTRFLAEVATVAGLQGIAVAGPTDPQTHPQAPVLLLVDTADGRGEPVRRRLAALAAADPSRPVGLVTAEVDQPDGPAPADPGVTAEVVLAPWTPAGLRIWLRLALRGEPAQELVDALARTGRGLPAPTVRRLARWRGDGTVVAGPDGGWTLHPDATARLSRPRQPVPVPPADIVGRSGAVDDVLRLLGGARLVTLVGPGGVGKTRLALEVAAQAESGFDDGVALVTLADATDVDQVVPVVAQRLGVLETADMPLADAVLAHLADRHLLLVLDNVEHVISAVPLVSRLLAAAPGVTVLATSRLRLAVPGEHPYDVPALTWPDLDRLPPGESGAAQALRESSAVALFVTRAREAAYDFQFTAAQLPTVVGVCARLDGLPLAIELAAARSDEFTPAQLLERLTDRLDLLVDGPIDQHDRQQTLRATIDWSVALLPPGERELLLRLGVFVGGFSRAAAVAVCGEAAGPALAALAERSLLGVRAGADADRFFMLETTRAYALEALAEAGTDAEVRLAHAGWYADLAQRAHAGISGPEQERWLRRLGEEYPNLRVAFGFAVAHRPELAARICAGLYRYWSIGNHMREARGWVDQVVAHAAVVPASLRAEVLHAGAQMAVYQNDNARAAELADRCLGVAEEVGARTVLPMAHNVLGIIAMDTGDLDAARRHFGEVRDLWTADGDPRVVVALANLAETELRAGNLDTAAELAGTALERNRVDAPWRVPNDLSRLGQIRLLRGELDQARALLQECLEIGRANSDVLSEGVVLAVLTRLAVLSGDGAQAVQVGTQALLLLGRLGMPMETASVLETFARLRVEDDAVLAVRLLAAADALLAAHGLCRGPAYQPFSDHTADRARQLLDPAAHADAQRRGRDAPLADTVALVLGG